MAASHDEEERLKSVALQTAQNILLARERAEDSLRQHSEWLHVTLSSIGDAVISTDTEGRVTFMNGVAELLTGWPLGEALGQPLSDVFQIVNEYTRQPVENPALRALREGRIVELANHTILIARDGTEHPVDDSAAPMRNKSDVSVGAVLVFRDVTEAKRAEKGLAELAAIVESSEDAIVSKTLDGIIRSWNTGAQRLFGYTPQEAIGQSITLVIPHDRRSEEQVIIDRLRRGERIEHFETVRVTKDGRLINISLTVSPLRDSTGQVVGASKIARDITAKKQAELERRLLQEQVEVERAQLAEVFQRAPSFLALLRGPQHTFELANERYYELVGKRDLIGKPVSEALPEITDQGFIELLDQVYRTGEGFVGTNMRIRLQRNLGIEPEERFLEFVLQSMRDTTGAVSGILAQGIDLTERQRAQEGLVRVTAESERLRRLHETILSGTPDFVYVFSLDYRVIYANDSLLTMWGVTAKQAIGKTFLEIGYEPWHAEMHCREIDEVRATKGPIRGEVPFNGTHGRRIYDYIFVPVLGADGEVESVAGTTRDITERRQMEDALRENDRKKDEFIAILAHELRNPLAPLRNGLQVLKLAGNDANMVSQVRGIMERQLTHMVRLIDDLLDISRIGQNKMELRRSPVLLAEVISSAVETARPVIEASGHELIVALPVDMIYLDADLTRLAQVFGNLLANSAKYTNNGGRIWVTAERQGTEVVIAVRDTGIGIPADSLARIFDMFSQVDRSIERSTGGLGIGLALVKGLVEMHDGTVTAYSAGQDQGSTFTVRLPLPAG